MTYTLTRHDDILTVTGILEDPVYLAEPFVLTEIFQRSSDTSFFPLTACEPIEDWHLIPEEMRDGRNWDWSPESQWIAPGAMCASGG